MAKKIDTLNDIFVHELSDMRNAEKQLVAALPKMVQAATDPKLRKAFESHLEETKLQVERIDRVAEICGFKIENEKCEALEGLVTEAKEVMADVTKGPLLDAALIVAGQKVEHYEIAGYGSLCELAKQLGYDEAAKILGDTLEEEKSADEKLSKLAVGGINEMALETAA